MLLIITGFSRVWRKHLCRICVRTPGGQACCTVTVDDGPGESRILALDKFAPLRSLPQVSIHSETYPGAGPRYDLGDRATLPLAGLLNHCLRSGPVPAPKNPTAALTRES